MNRLFVLLLSYLSPEHLLYFCNCAYLLTLHHLLCIKFTSSFVFIKYIIFLITISGIQQLNPWIKLSCRNDCSNLIFEGFSNSLDNAHYPAVTNSPDLSLFSSMNFLNGYILISPVSFNAQLFCHQVWLNRLLVINALSLIVLCNAWLRNEIDPLNTFRPRNLNGMVLDNYL